MHLNEVLACAYLLASVASMVMPQGSAPPQRESGLESWAPVCEVVAAHLCPAADACPLKSHPTYAGPACMGK